MHRPNLFAAALIASLAGHLVAVPSASAQICTPTLGNTLDTFGEPKEIDIVGDIMYIADRGRGLRTYLVGPPASPANPAFLGELLMLDLSTSIFGRDQMTAEGNFVYLVVGSELRVIDVSNPSTPTLRGSVVLPGGVVEDIIAHDGHVYIGGFLRLDIIDVTDPDAPAPAGLVALRGGFQVHLARKDDLLFVHTGSPSLISFDITDRANPVQLGAVDAFFDVNGMTRLGDRLYCAFDGGVLGIIDITDPADMTFVDQPLISAQEIIARGGLLYATVNGGIRVLDASNPDVLAVAGSGSSGTSNSSARIDAFGGFAYMTDGGNGIRVFDVSGCSLAPLITLQPENALAAAGDGPVNFSVGAVSGSGFQWRLNGETLEDGPLFSGTTTGELTVLPGTATQGLYDVIVTNAQGSTTSDSAALVVSNPCPADLAASFGVLDLSDIAAFVTAFNAGCP